MRAGTVLSTGINCTSEVEILINQQVRFRAAPGRIGRGLATRIVEPVIQPGVRKLPAPSTPEPNPVA